MNRCRAGNRCADLATITHQPAEVGADGDYCLACLQRAQGRIRALPAQYAHLQLLLHITGHTAPEARHVAPGPAVLLNLHVEALGRDIGYMLALVGEIVADLVHLDDPADLGSCADLVADGVHHLAELPPWPVLLWARSGTWRRLAELAGVQLIETLDRLHQVASITLGTTRARTRRDLPCARCRAKTVGRWAGSDYYDCTSCGARWHENDIRRQDRILIELHRRGKLRT